MAKATYIEVEGRRLKLSNRDKVLYPATGTTKGEVIDYYRAVTPVILPLIAGHPLTRKRFPDGVAATGFFEKNCPPYHPEWMDTVSVPSRRVEDKRTEYCVIHTAAGLVWLANLAALELHPALHRVEDPTHPRALVFDLDPGAPAGLEACVALAERLRGLLERVGLTPFVKLSGGKGLHLWVPVRGATYDETKAFARALAQVMERDDPQRVVARMGKAERAGRVFIDWSQNDRNKTTVAAYSLRAREEPTVSLPVTWDELLAARDPGRLRLSFDAALARIAQQGDPWRDLFHHAALLPSTVELGAAPVPAAGAGAAPRRARGSDTRGTRSHPS